MSKKITFFLMTEKGYEALNGFVLKFGPDAIAEVVVSDDPSIENCFFEDIIKLCESNGIPWYNKTDKIKINGDYSFAISWRWIIKDYYNLIVFHDSLLPKYRGFAPLVNALINGEKKVGVSAIKACANYDTGNIIAQKSIHIKYPIKISEAIKKIVPLYTALVNEIAEQILQGKTIIGKKQNEKLATYSLWRDEEDYLIDWNQPAEFIKRFIDAVGKPYKGAASFIGSNKVRILDAIVLEDKKIENRDNGKVIFINDGFPVIVCGKNLLQIKEMIYDESGKSALPLKKIRTRFRNFPS